MTLALAGILLGLALAAAEGHFTFSVALLTVWTAVLLQVLSNLANDYGDSVHGADGAGRAGPPRAVSAGAVSARAMRRAVAATAFLAAMSGAALILLALGTEALAGLLLFAVLGLLAIWAAINYTAGRAPYGYAGLGDVAVFVFFGWLSVGGAYFLQAGRLPAVVLLPSSTVGLLSVAVLNVNNMRDIHSDRLAGKRTIPVRLGLRRARYYHWLLLALALGLAAIYARLSSGSPWNWLFLVSIPLVVQNAWSVWRRPPEQLDPLLAQMSLTTLAFSLTFGFGQLLS